MNGGVIKAPVFPRREGQEVNVVVANVSEGGVDGGKLEGADVLQEVAVGLVCSGVLADRNSVVRQWMGLLLDVRLERYYWEG